MLNRLVHGSLQVIVGSHPFCSFGPSDADELGAADAIGTSVVGSGSEIAACVGRTSAINGIYTKLPTISLRTTVPHLS